MRTSPRASSFSHRRSTARRLRLAQGADDAVHASERKHHGAHLVAFFLR
jgi:hypothetical protein